MNDEIDYKNNPLHGVSLKKLLVEMVDHYGFEILYAYLSINCFKTNPSIESSIKFLKKTDWAREKVEAFYMYQFKNLPRASASQFELAPRDRIVPEGQTPGEPKELSLEDAERLREKRAKKAASGGRGSGHRSDEGKKSSVWKNDRKSSNSSRDSRQSAPTQSGSDPWSKWKK